MAQPPDYGSYVKREPKRFNLRKFLKIALFVTVALALVEVVILLFFVGDKKKAPKATAAVDSTGVQKTDSGNYPQAASTYSQPTEQSSYYSTDSTSSPQSAQTVNSGSGSANSYSSPASPVVSATPSSSSSSYMSSVPSSSTSDTKASVPAAKKPETKAIPKSTASTVTTKTETKAIKKPVQKELSQDKMQDILRDINELKSKFHNNCVQVRKTMTSNASNAFQVAEFLKARGFIIGGRLTVSGTTKGVKVDAGESCIEVTIGTI